MAVFQAFLVLICPLSIRQYRQVSPLLLTLLLTIADTPFLGLAILYWLGRGGGGNFGVVTSFEYRLHPVGPEVTFCFVLYPGDRAKEVLQACEEYMVEAPDEVSPLGVLGRVPHDPLDHGQRAG